MTTTVIVKMEGISATLGSLEALKLGIQKRVLRKAIRAGAQPLVKALRRNAPRKTGLFKRTLAYKIKTYPTVVVAIIGQKKGHINWSRVKRGATGGISGRGDLLPIHLVVNPTKSHLIEPRAAETMAINHSGNIQFRRLAHHPGTRGNDFVVRSNQESDAESKEAFKAKLVIEVGAEVNKAKAG